jgi:hypothetical protein
MSLAHCSLALLFVLNFCLGVPNGATTLSKTTLDMMTLGIRAPNKTTLSICMHASKAFILSIVLKNVIPSVVMLSVIKISVVILCVIILGVVTLTVIILSVVILSINILSGVILSGVILSVIILSVFILSVTMLSIVILNVVMLSVVILSVVAPIKFQKGINYFYFCLSLYRQEMEANRACPFPGLGQCF